jgi:tRNA(adenine34) deaminase
MEHDPRKLNPPPGETAAWFLSQGRAFHEKWMALALAEARIAADDGEVPMGCVVVRKTPGGEARSIARAHNSVEMLKDPTAHAEMLATTQAAAAVGDWRLTDCAIYVTKEPCPMCGGAVILARYALVVWAASDPKRGAHSVFGLFGHSGLNHRPETLPDFGPESALQELRGFFRQRRNKRPHSPFFPGDLK